MVGFESIEKNFIVNAGVYWEPLELLGNSYSSLFSLFVQVFRDVLWM